MSAEPLELTADDQGTAQFNGLRMTVDEFLRLPDDGCNYELLDGVVVMSPRPKPSHQRAAGEIFRQISQFLRQRPVGQVFYEVDVHLGRGPKGDIVYAPDIVYVRRERLSKMRDKINGPPDLV